MTTRSPEHDSTLHIHRSPGRTTALLLSLAMLLVGGAGMVLDPAGGRGIPEINFLIGWLGTIYFGSLTILLLWSLVSLRGPVVTLSPEGLRDRRHSPDFIPWSAVATVYTRALNSRADKRYASVFAMEIKPDQFDRFAPTTYARLMAYLNVLLERRPNELSIPTLTLAMRPEELRTAASAYLERHGRQA